MATAKKTTAPKTVKKAAAAKDASSLQDELAAKQQDLLEARRSHAGGELVNPRVLRATRKEIARLHTAIREAALKESK